VDVVESVHENISKIVGIRKPVIVMPVAEFADFEYRIIFIHELTHYKQKALWLKHLTAIALAFHFFNPFIWLLDRKVQEWGETACDYESIKYVGDVKTYFEVLFQLAVDEKRRSSLQANLVERKGELETRLLRMKRSYKLMNKKKTWAAALAVSAMMVASTVSVSAATISAGNTYMSLYNASVEEEDDGMLTFSSTDTDEVLTFASTEEMVIYNADGLDEGFTETVGELEPVKQGVRWVSGFGWDISKKASKRTDTFTANKGDTVSVMVSCTPSDATIHVGIIKPDGTRSYVSHTGIFGCLFTCESTGTYCVYVQNMSSEKISVDGSYIITSN
jgi:hypothetical protein